MNNSIRLLFVSWVTLSAFAVEADTTQQQRDYDEHLANMAKMRKSTTAASMAVWRPLYDAMYEQTANQYSMLPALAKTQAERVKAEKIVEYSKKIAHQLGECYQVHMAIAYPNATLSDTSSLGEAIRRQNQYFKRTAAYDNGLVTVSLTCANIPSPPETN
jgi:hypothetical protein